MNRSHLFVASTLLTACSLFAARAATPAATAPDGAVAAACRQDVEKLCPGVQPGEGRIAACLREKRKEISDPCKSALKAERGKRGKHAKE